MLSPIFSLRHSRMREPTHDRRKRFGLRDRFRCIASDFPGFGRSGAPSDVGFTPVVQDWGGPIGRRWRRLMRACRVTFSRAAFFTREAS